MVTCDLLYIAFVDLNDKATSGSSVRPQKMLEAFRKLGLDIKVLDGWNNQRRLRRTNVRQILEWLKENRPQMCYVEPPSGPIFCNIDLRLLRKLHKMHVPIALFYRDAYWKFPEFSMGQEKRDLVNRTKRIVIKWMQQRDWKVFRRVCSHIFFPSDTMAEHFDCENKSALPPGAVSDRQTDITAEQERICKADVLHYFYVGAASKRYGIDLLMSAFKEVNADGLCAKLICVCPENQWKEYYGDRAPQGEWLELHHVSGDEKLAPLYEKADVCIVAALRCTYNDFGIPIKLFEYFSYRKPVAVTNCVEALRILEHTKAGWVFEDNAEALKKLILQLDADRAAVLEAKKNSIAALEENTWEKRAQTVIDILSQSK